MTVLCWVHYLGFSQDKLKKLYYVDGHGMRNKRNTAANLLKDTFQILNGDLIDEYRCQLRRLNLFNHHY
jgi:hypothetical protein